MELQVKPTTRLKTPFTIASNVTSTFTVEAYVEHDSITIATNSVNQGVKALEVILRDDNSVWEVIQNRFAVWTQHFIQLGAYFLQDGTLPLPATKVSEPLEILKSVPEICAGDWIIESGTSQIFTLVKDQGKLSVLTTHHCESFHVCTKLIAWFVGQEQVTSAMFEESNSGYLILDVAEDGEPLSPKLTPSLNARKAAAGRSLAALRHLPSVDIRVPVMAPLPNIEVLAKMPTAYEVLSKVSALQRRVVAIGTVVKSNQAKEIMGNTLQGLAGLRDSGLYDVELILKGKKLLRWKYLSE